MTMIGLAEYIWLDGSIPTRTLRSKARVISQPEGQDIQLQDFPEWSFDGSSTKQAEGHDSDCLLQPVYFVNDPVRGAGNYLVMCEVLNPDGTPHIANSRAQLREILDAGAAKEEPWAGFEQEYTMFEADGSRPLGWPENGYPAPQGPYYCAVGAREIMGRELVEAHAQLCMDAGLAFYGINAEVMPSQWEFQIGYRGIKGEAVDILTMSDQLWIARWLLKRLSEEYGVHISFDNKPVKGDWNGAGMHTNFSTKNTRDSKIGLKAIEAAIAALSQKHSEHIAVYGHANHERLTGLHETCDIHTFRSGKADRGSSIRIPKQVEQRGCGYFEDRRPGANADPYLVAARLCATVCSVDDKLMKFDQWPRNNVRSIAA